MRNLDQQFLCQEGVFPFFFFFWGGGVPKSLKNGSNADKALGLNFDFWVESLYLSGAKNLLHAFPAVCRKTELDNSSLSELANVGSK